MDALKGPRMDGDSRIYVADTCDSLSQPEAGALFLDAGWGEFLFCVQVRREDGK